MLVLLLLQLDVQDALSDCQLAQFLDFLEIVLDCLLGDHLQSIEDSIAEVGVLIVLVVLVVYLVQVPQLVLQLSQQDGLLLLLDGRFPQLAD